MRSSPPTFTEDKIDMKHRTWLLGSLVAVVMGCPGGLGNLAGGVGGSCNGDLGAGAALQKVEVFVASANEFAAAANELDQSLLTACRQMATDMQIPESELAAHGDQSPTQAVCTRVATQLREDMTAIRAVANLRAEVTMVPPQCQVSVDAYARCAGECDVSYTPGQAEIQCEGGELRGQCSAQCTGRCAVEVSGQCNGTCEGTCSARDAQGNCTGACQGRCVSQASGTCGGECRGGCSVAYTQPTCTGRVQPPQVNADCRAACDARLDAQATCTPGRAELRITGNAGTDLEARVRRVRAALGGGFGQVLLLRAKVERTARSGAQLVRAAQELPNAIGNAGARAVMCATSAATATVSAMAKVNVSVSVSVQVSGSVTASGG